MVLLLLLSLSLLLSLRQLVVLPLLFVYVSDVCMDDEDYSLNCWSKYVFGFLSISLPASVGSTRLSASVCDIKHYSYYLARGGELFLFLLVVAVSSVE